MKILFVEWISYGKDDLKAAFEAEGHHLISFPFSVEGDLYHDLEVENRFVSVLHNKVPDIVFSTDYFPLISGVCFKENIRYISWVYDSPFKQLFTQSVVNSCNKIYVFDKSIYLKFCEMGIRTVHYLPLAVNTKRLDLLSMSDQKLPFSYDISFVGSLYLEKSSVFDKMRDCTPEYLKGYLDAVIAAQLKIHGCNLVEEMISPVVDQLHEIFPIIRQPGGFESGEYLYAQYVINPRITSIERIDYLDAVAQKHIVDLFTYYGGFTMPNVCNHGRIDYMSEMPCVFRKSRINLNITLRSIQSGIPLRAFDIMGSGGFLLSNFQADFLDFFVPDEDFVYYESKEDLVQKVDYYLIHEDERRAIARNGHDKVASKHTYRHRIREMLDL